MPGGQNGQLAWPPKPAKPPNGDIAAGDQGEGGGANGQPIPGIVVVIACRAAMPGTAAANGQPAVAAGDARAPPALAASALTASALALVIAVDQMPIQNGPAQASHGAIADMFGNANGDANGNWGAAGNSAPFAMPGNAIAGNERVVGALRPGRPAQTAGIPQACGIPAPNGP